MLLRYIGTSTKLNGWRNLWTQSSFTASTAYSFWPLLNISICIATKRRECKWVRKLPARKHSPRAIDRPYSNVSFVHAIYTCASSLVYMYVYLYISTSLCMCVVFDWHRHERRLCIECAGNVTTDAVAIFTLGYFNWWLKEAYSSVRMFSTLIAENIVQLDFNQAIFMRATCIWEFNFSEKLADRYTGRKQTLAEQIATGKKFECEYVSLPYTTYKRNCMHYTVFHNMLACKPLPVCKECHLTKFAQFRQFRTNYCKTCGHDKYEGMVNTRRLVSIDLQKRSFDSDFPPLIGWGQHLHRFFFDMAISLSSELWNTTY